MPASDHHSSVFRLLLPAIALLTPALPSLAHGAVEVTLHEKVYQRRTGRPVVVEDRFRGVDGTATITVTNLGENGTRVSSAVIKINGTLVFGPEHFSQRAEMLSAGISVEATNSLSVEMRAKPGGSLAVKVVQLQEALDISHLYTVPLDLTQVTYPRSYTTETIDPADVSTDPCNLDLSVVTYPKSWLGERPLPDVVGAPLDAGTMRAVALKDIMLHDNPAFILAGAPDAPTGCTGDLLSEFEKTIQRLVTLGVDYVYLPQWHWASKRQDGSWFFIKADDTFGPVSDADLAYFVRAAHAHGIKVIMRNQIQGMVDPPSSFAYVPPATMDNLRLWFGAYQDFMIERSGFFESLGIDVWEVGCNYCMYAEWMAQTPEEVDLFAEEYGKAVSSLRLQYTGRLLLETSPWLDQKPTLMSMVDILGSRMWDQPLTADQAANLSVESYKTALVNSGWPQFVSHWSSFGKPMMLTLGFQSRQNLFALPGYMEETACTSRIGDLNVSNTDCIQRDTQADFSLQATLVEASMEVISSLNLSVRPIVLVGDYWATDPLTPQTAFPNLSASPRNKPAEGILKLWFAR